MKDDHKKPTLKVWFRSGVLLKDDDEIYELFKITEIKELEKKGYILIRKLKKYSLEN